MKAKFLVLAAMAIMASSCAQTSFTGRITFEGKGIGSVAVSDGYSVVLTDSRGRYSIDANPRARTLHFSVPAGYKIPLDSLNSPAFFVHIDPAKPCRNDFSLERLEAADDNWTFVAVSDPQCKYLWHAARFRNETVPDMQSTLRTSKFPNAIAVTLGDLVYDKHDMYEPMQKAVGNILLDDGSFLPMFNCMGNHDNNYSLLTEDGPYADADYDAEGSYYQWYGPADYSFNRGQAHIVVMDDMFVTQKGNKTCKYDAGFTAEQVEWLRADLAAVPDLENKLLLFCTHSPFRQGAKRGGGNVNYDRYYKDVLELLTQAHEAHIIIGHTHYPQLYVHSDYVCRGGQPIFEQIHAAVCGCWWHTNLCVDGTPNGYAVYEIQGNSVHNFLPKAVGSDDFNCQIRAYNGNAVYSGKHATYRWEPEYKGKVIASVFYDDPEYWDVSFVYNGTESPMTRVTRDQRDWCAYSYFINVSERDADNSSYYRSPRHFWTIDVPGGDISRLKDWKIVAHHRVPTSGVVNEYTCTTLGDDYSEFMFADPAYEVLPEFDVLPDFSAKPVR